VNLKQLQPHAVCLVHDLTTIKSNMNTFLWPKPDSHWSKLQAI